MAAINLARDAFHGEWNYTIKPQAQLRSSRAVIPRQAPSITVQFSDPFPPACMIVGGADEHGIIGSDVRVVGVVVAGREDADPALVHASARGEFGGCVSGWPAGS